MIDVLQCPRCHGRMRVLAFITDPPVIAQILDHLGLSTTGPPLAPRWPRRAGHRSSTLSRSCSPQRQAPARTLTAPSPRRKGRDPPAARNSGALAAPLCPIRAGAAPPAAAGADRLRYRCLRHPWERALNVL